MTFGRFGCARFRKLAHERNDRVLNLAEERFMHEHVERCPECAEVEESANLAMDLLRSTTFEVEVAPRFEERVLRRYRVQDVRESLGYWSPALAGAGIACLALFAALTMLGNPGGPKEAERNGSTAKMEVGQDRSFPTLELRASTRFVP